MYRVILGGLIVLSALPASGADGYGANGSVPNSTSYEQPTRNYQQQNNGAYALTPGPVGTQGQMNDPRLRMDKATPDVQMRGTSLDATNPQNDSSYR